MCISKRNKASTGPEFTDASVFDTQPAVVSVQDRMTQELQASLILCPSRHDKVDQPQCAHHVVKHNYHDHANDIDQMIPQPLTRGGISCPFPVKLHEMLDRIEEDGYASIVSWQPHGRAFVVHKPKQFVQYVMPTYFKQSKIASFQRQLNLYGFSRLTKGRDKNGYYHELFLRGKKFLANKIIRSKVKGTGVRARSNPGTEPNFYAMSPLDKCESPTAVRIGALDQGVSSTVEISTQGESRIAPIPSILSSQTDLLDQEKQNKCTTTSNKSQQNVTQQHDDDVLFFAGRSFHYLDPSEYKKKRGGDFYFSETNLFNPKDETVRFLSALNITQDLYNEIVEKIDDDRNLGFLLEQVID